MKVFKNIFSLVGNTPLVQLQNYCRKHSTHAKILAKLESFNPGGSVKDRIAAQMINHAEKNHLLHSDTTIIEPTSGNTGIGLACMAAAKGYRTILTMPESMSHERRALLRALGATVVLTSANHGMKGAIEKAQQLNSEIKNSIILSQFTNPANPLAHKKTTGPEIWRDAGKKVDIFVAGVGTGGTITGAGDFLKRKNKKITIVAVEPADSPLLSQNTTGAHAIQGLGAGFVPEVLNKNIYDKVIAVSTQNATLAARQLASTEGILVGISSGAALWAATQLATRAENKNKTIVVVLPDGGERYLSTPLFADDM